MIKQTEHLKIGDLLSQRVPFRVPAYQRGYAWEEDDIRDFVDDLKALISSHPKRTGSRPSHFFGGLVSVHHFDQGSSGRAFEVVDGQQRLATFVLTLSLLVAALDALAEEARSQGDQSASDEAAAHATKARAEFLFYQEVVGSQVEQRHRLTLSRRDDAFFKELLSASDVCRPSKASHYRLVTAKKIIHDVLIRPIQQNTADLTQRKDQLLSIVSSITECCHVIHIVSDDPKEAYQLFAVLNDRGRSLTDGDLLRARTLEKLEGDRGIQSRAEEAWDEILGGRQSEIEHFLRAHFSSHVGLRAPRHDLADAFYAEFFDRDIGKSVGSMHQQLLQAITRMRTSMVFFRQLAKAEWPFEESKVSPWKRDRLSRLIGTLRHTLSLPLLLAARDCLEDEAFASLVILLERFAFRYITVVGAHEGAAQSIYYEHSKKMRLLPKSYPISSFASELAVLVNTKASDPLFSTSLVENLKYSSSGASNSAIRHFLTTLEDYYDWYEKGQALYPIANEMTVFDLRNVTIEHIYPQNPRRRRKAMEELKHDIGNLSFWAPLDNQSAANDPFGAKKEAYAKSSVRLNRELARLADWTIQELQIRRGRLTKMAIAMFRI